MRNEHRGAEQAALRACYLENSAAGLKSKPDDDGDDDDVAISPEDGPQILMHRVEFCLTPIMPATMF